MSIRMFEVNRCLDFARRSKFDPEKVDLVVPEQLRPALRDRGIGSKIWI